MRPDTSLALLDMQMLRLAGSPNEGESQRGEKHWDGAMTKKRALLVAVALVTAIAVLASGCGNCSCDAPGLTYLSTEGFPEVVGAEYPFRIELCREDGDCRTIRLPSNQVITIAELGSSQTTPEMPDFTVSFLGTETTLSQEDFVIRTDASSGCCSDPFHIIKLRR